MIQASSLGFKKSELFEPLALMVMGACAWIIGVDLGAFDRATAFAIRHHLMDLIMLSTCMGFGLVVATIRKSFLLRRAIAARLKAETAAEESARHDALTGLANRRLLRERMDAAFASQTRERRFAVMLVDLDRFKPVNDLYGHAAGNALLCAVADRLTQNAPADSTVARLGGDEFVVLLPVGVDPSKLGEIAQSLIDAVRRPVAWGQGQVEVDATIGIAVAEARGQDGEGLLNQADIAMYDGKREGRGTFRFFLQGMDVAQKARAQLEAELRSAIQRGEIAPYYQPIVSLPERTLVGFEVLARWSHPTRGLVSPDEFIPIAEQSGVISDLFFGLLRQSCADAKDWPSHLQLSINVSPRQLRDLQMPLRIASIVAQANFAPHRLEIEVTESALINDLESARAILTDLQTLGVRIALDDFGTGYSSLYHLKELRFNKLKIDRSYVSEMQQGSERARLVDAIIQLGSSLSLQTTAEGVENEQNLEWLSNQGCTYAQGYLFGRPMGREDIDSFLKGEADGAAPKGGDESGRAAA